MTEIVDPTEHLIQLYNLSLAKWKNIQHCIEQGIYQQNKRNLLHDMIVVCAFCYDTLETIRNNIMGTDEVPLFAFYGSLTTDGHICGKHCLIDKNICGSTKSLLYMAVTETKINTDGTMGDKEFKNLKKYVNKIVNKMIAEKSKLIEIYTKTNTQKTTEECGKCIKNRIKKKENI